MVKKLIKKLFIYITSCVLVFFIGFYIGIWSDAQRRLEDEALYLAYLHENLFELVAERKLFVDDYNFSTQVKIHVNRYLYYRQYSPFPLDEDEIFCDSFQMHENQKVIYRKILEKDDLGKYLFSRINFCKYDFKKYFQ